MTLYMVTALMSKLFSRSDHVSRQRRLHVRHSCTFFAENLTVTIELRCSNKAHKSVYYSITASNPQYRPLCPLTISFLRATQRGTTGSMALEFINLLS